MNQELTTQTQIDPIVLAKKQEAWKELAKAVYVTEIQLDNMAKTAINSIVTPLTINDIPNSELNLKHVKLTQSEIEEKRKEITNKFRDVTERLMIPEKSFIEPIKKLTDEIIKIKKAYEVEQKAASDKLNEIRLLKESVVKYCAELDAKLKLFMNDLMDKSFVYALEKPIILADINAYIKSESKKGIESILAYKFEKLNANLSLVTVEEWAEIKKANNTISLIDYANQFDTSIREKFNDYEVALSNKKDALRRNQQEKIEATKAIADEKLNNEIAASLESSATSLVPEIIVDTKALKKSYEIDMPETPDSNFVIWGAYSANRKLVEEKLRVKNWLLLTSTQICGALSRIKSDNNEFDVKGLVWKEVSKL